MVRIAGHESSAGSIGDFFPGRFRGLPGTRRAPLLDCPQPDIPCGCNPQPIPAMPSSVITRKSRFAIPVPVNSSNNVLLKISYGFGQTGGSALERAPGQTPEKGDNFDLGPANQLRGRYVITKSVVADVSDATNFVDAEYTFTCGNAVVTKSVDPLEVDNDGDPAILLSRFEFV